MGQEQFKTFIQAITMVSQNHLKAKSFLNDKRLTLKEKKLIMGSLSLRDGDLAAAEEIVLQSFPFESDILNGIANLLYGAIKNNQGRFTECMDLTYSGLELLKDEDIPRLQFSAYRTIFYCGCNLFDKEAAGSAIKWLKTYKPQNIEEELAIILADFSHAIRFEENSLKANALNKELIKRHKDFNEIQFIHYYYDLIDLHIMNQDFLGAKETTLNLKKYRKYYDKDYYKYLVSLLDFINEGKTIYLYAELKEDSRRSYYEIEVINSLLQRNMQKANVAWAMLMKEIPLLYNENFVINHKSYLFKHFLDLVQTNKSTDVSIELSGSKIEKLHQLLLLHKDQGINKEELYQLVWETPLIEKNDVQKMSKMLNVIKKKYNIKIEHKKGTYKLVA